MITELGLCDSLERTKRLVDVAQEMQTILCKYFVGGFSRLSDEEQDALFVGIDKVLRFIVTGFEADGTRRLYE